MDEKNFKSKEIIDLYLNTFKSSFIGKIIPYLNHKNDNLKKKLEEMISLENKYERGILLDCWKLQDPKCLDDEEKKFYGFYDGIKKAPLRNSLFASDKEYFNAYEKGRRFNKKFIVVKYGV